MECTVEQGVKTTEPAGNIHHSVRNSVTSRPEVHQNWAEKATNLYRSILRSRYHYVVGRVKNDATDWHTVPCQAVSFWGPGDPVISRSLPLRGTSFVLFHCLRHFRFQVHYLLLEAEDRRPFLFKEPIELLVVCFVGWLSG